ncbi:hypothetical protein HDU98_006390 [Podochytrium sp. JEL0797]|nr:hypothetical protein HDU98_006390 [Podochytrium sp. JEL0797]
MKFLRANEFSAFDPILAHALATSTGRVFVVLVATEDPATGESWCPDCRVSEPLIRTAIESVPASTLLVVPTGDRPTWKSSDNAYRHHPLLKCTGVPTLYEFAKNGSLKQKLVDSAETPISEEALKKFIQ